MKRLGWIGLIIFAGAAFIWWYFGNRQDEPSASEKVLTPPTEQLVTLERLGLYPFKLSLAEQANEVKFIEPSPAEADPSAVQAWFEAFQTAKIIRSFPADTFDDSRASEFGLRNPEVILKWNDGTRVETWMLGGFSPIGGERYVLIDDELYLVEGVVADIFQTTSDSLRQRHLCPQIDTLAAVTVGPDDPWQIRWINDQATLTEPVRDRVDPDLADRLNRLVQSLRVELTLDQLPEDSLEPSLTIRLEDTKGDQCEFKLSQRTDSQQKQAACRSDGSLCGIFSADSVEDWFIQAAEWRDRRIFDLSLNNTEQIEIQSPPNNYQLFIKRQEGWQTKDQAAVNEDWLRLFFSALQNIKAISFEPIPDYTMTHHIKLTHSENSQHEIKFYRNDHNECAALDIFNRYLSIECEAIQNIPWTTTETDDISSKSSNTPNS